jgi:hypothetical protein
MPKNVLAGSGMAEATLYRSLKTDGIQRRLRQPTVTRNCSTLLTESEVVPGSTSTGTSWYLRRSSFLCVTDAGVPAVEQLLGPELQI